MSIEGYIEALVTKHATADAELEKELERRQPDTLAVKHLKQVKYHLKQKMTAAQKKLDATLFDETTTESASLQPESLKTQSVPMSVHSTQTGESVSEPVDLPAGCDGHLPTTKIA